MIDYNTTYINNRRYLGNKYNLLGFIKHVVDTECDNIKIVADIFSGTGVVASAFSDKQLITNDNLYSNYICHVAWFSPKRYSYKKIVKYIKEYNSIIVKDDNYVSNNFSDTFFSKENCKKIGYIRENIEELYNAKKINFKERAILITSLLYAMDKIANTCGHYDAYIKNNKSYLEKKLELYVPIKINNLNINNVCYNMDSNELVKSIEADLVYIDPPYNSRQYCDTYHFLENIARWDKPEVKGIAKKMNRNNIKSLYCTNSATEVFEELISNIKSKYILLSYNNTSTKGDCRSNAKISDNDIIRILKNKGKVKVFSEDHKLFNAGKSNIKDNKERLFLCECYDINEMVQSPINYTGGKFRLLPQILPYIPEKINTFVDLFCGGCEVGINVNSKNVIFNDINSKLINLYRTLKKLNKKDTFSIIESIINKYYLSLTKDKGYQFYNCNSIDGLASYNKNKFENLKNDFNSLKNYDNNYYIMLFVLIVYSFNNQIRFNNSNEYNMPVGKRDFNKNIVKKLDLFIDKIKNKNTIFMSNDFRNFDLYMIEKEDFLYMDPPYLLGRASYNENNSWTKKDENDLLDFINIVNNKKIKFALSNVISNKSIKNNILINWIEKYNYKLIKLNYSYSNSNYQRKEKNSITEEVLIINY
ncbi:Dam family site-specific DNA-(adenine-N6)-methyltransferase [Brachyspira catarrhinii]|uniref:Site-specific DNA-methyltransferase (adenine-specific) n=1 Tax=Brachyspira catarrhinii TaxID=2528966 RepID=A0ABY2TQK2_9SPIR|nr:Dam family site-specific DNA-(adenine-N6)-methyltransferase [Brachyspira catarrhinii]TKZ33894.1 Dam family site-specific DNA-(adenine-N6)-methyltransferase [Brachyspira catarrhinii]